MAACGAVRQAACQPGAAHLALPAGGSSKRIGCMVWSPAGLPRPSTSAMRLQNNNNAALSMGQVGALPPGPGVRLGRCRAKTWLASGRPIRLGRCMRGRTWTPLGIPRGTVHVIPQLPSVMAGPKDQVPGPFISHGRPKAPGARTHPARTACAVPATAARPRSRASASQPASCPGSPGLGPSPASTACACCCPFHRLPPCA